MGKKALMTGTEAIAQAAILAGCTHFFGYPITPQSELLEYMAAHLPKRGGVFLQSENETAAINMVFGAAAAGARVLTASSDLAFRLWRKGFHTWLGQNSPVSLSMLGEVVRVWAISLLLKLIIRLSPKVQATEILNLLF